MTTWLSVWWILLHGLFGQGIVSPIMSGRVNASGGGSPAHVITKAAAVNASVGTYTLNLDATGVGAFALGLTYQTGSGCSSTITSVVGGASGVDVFTIQGTESANTFQCTSIWFASGIHTSNSYNIVATVTSGASFMGMGASGFTVVTALDGTQTCKGFGTSSPVSCSSALTPSSSDVCVAVSGDYYNGDTITAGTGYTIPTNGAANHGTAGDPAQIVMIYQLCNSASTPSVNVTGTIYTTVVGAAFK